MSGSDDEPSSPPVTTVTRQARIASVVSLFTAGCLQIVFVFNYIMKTGWSARNLTSPFIIIPSVFAILTILVGICACIPCWPRLHNQIIAVLDRLFFPEPAPSAAHELQPLRERSVEDPAKRQERERVAKVQRQEAQERSERQARLEQHRERLRATIPMEPATSEPGGTVRIRVQFPNGSKLERIFSTDDSLESLFNVVFCDSSCQVEDFTLKSGYPPKPLPCKPDWHLSELASNDDSNAYVGESSSGSSTDRRIPTFREGGLEWSCVVIVQDNAANKNDNVNESEKKEFL